jgi:DNA-binding IscR family transcriptional regulator
MPLDCLSDATACVISPTCGMREVWQEVVAATRDILQRTTIEDLVARQKVRESRVMYYI